MKRYLLSLLRFMLIHDKEHGIIAVVPWFFALLVAVMFYVGLALFLSEISGIDTDVLLLITLVFFLPVVVAIYPAFFLLTYSWIAFWLPMLGINVDSLRQKLRRLAGV